jgi:hypothetical protein
VEQRLAWAQQDLPLFAFVFDVADVAALDSLDQRQLDDEVPEYALHVA